MSAIFVCSFLFIYYYYYFNMKPQRNKKNKLNTFLDLVRIDCVLCSVFNKAMYSTNLKSFLEFESEVVYCCCCSFYYDYYFYFFFLFISTVYLCVPCVVVRYTYNFFFFCKCKNYINNKTVKKSFMLNWILLWKTSTMKESNIKFIIIIIINLIFKIKLWW